MRSASARTRMTSKEVATMWESQASMDIEVPAGPGRGGNARTLLRIGAALEAEPAARTREVPA